MRNRRMKADSVDQLFEIVKAVQMGQDPEEMLRKKQEENAEAAAAEVQKLNLQPEEADVDDDMEEFSSEKSWKEAFMEKKNLLFSRKQEPVTKEKTVGKEKEEEFLDNEWEDDDEDFSLKKHSHLRNLSKKDTVDDGWEDDDDFMAILNDDSSQRLDVDGFVEKIGGAVAFAAGAFGQLKKSMLKKEKPAKKEKGSKKLKDDEAYLTQDETDEERIPVQEEAYEASDIPAEKEVSEASDIPAEEEVSETAGVPAEEVFEAAVPMQEEASETAQIPTQTEDADPEETSADAKTIDRILDIPNTSEGQADPEADVLSEAEEEFPDNGIDLEEDAIRGQSDKEQEASIKKKISDRLKKEQGTVPEKRHEKPRKGELREAGEEEAKKKLSDIPAMIRDSIFNFADKMRERGISRKECILILLGVVLAACMAVMVTKFVRTAMENKKKSEYVTADAGLKITVEKEPDQWCQSYPISMKVRTKGNIVPKVTIDGAYYEPNEEGLIYVRARDYLLHASVETDNGTLNAQIEIPMIDNQLPVVSAVKENNMITLTAADGRSGVSAVMYAMVRESDYIKIPHYLTYSEPFPYEEGCMYYFYAEDLAGNKSIPVVTTMEEAEAIVLGKEEISLFPGESVYLNVDGKPHGALLNNLTYESMNPSVVTVDGTGLITAHTEGNTAVKIKADGLTEVLCPVEVSRTREITISAIGDCTLGSDYSFNTNINFQAFETVNGPSYFFQNVKDILENDDATFANLEGVFTELNTRENKQYAFKGDPDYTQILLDGSVEVVTLANNHSSDYGEQSQKDTKMYLNNAGIDYCVGDTITIQELKGVKTAFIGIYVLYDGMAREEQVRATIAEAKAQGAQLVVVAFHWGSEKATQPDQTQTSLAHLAIDEGADLVVGHHPHVLQGIEKYNGKYIVYSLANFCFGGNTNPSDKDTIIFRQTFTVTEGTVLNDDQIEIVPCTVSGTSGYNDYQPTPATGTDADRIMDRLNEYSAQFEQSFTASNGLE